MNIIISSFLPTNFKSYYYADLVVSLNKLFENER
jgi:hypothetical protein